MNGEPFRLHKPPKVGSGIRQVRQTDVLDSITFAFNMGPLPGVERNQCTSIPETEFLL
jgi:hypothetical protein